MCSRDANISESLEAALNLWAVENDCSCIDIESDSQFIRVWMMSLCAAAFFCLLVTVPVCWSGQKKEPGFDLGDVEEGSDKGDKRLKQTKKKSSTEFMEATESAGPEPNIEMAKEYLRRTSATKNGEWRSLWGTSLSDMAEIGGTGTELYFRLLRNLGILFIYMGGLTCASVAFNVVSNFAPDNGQFLTKTTIGNVGASSKSDLLSPDQRYIILKNANGCQGTEVTKLTAVMGWLDLIATILFLVFVVRFRFSTVPKIAKQSDDEQITPKDFSVEIDNLPRRFDGMEEKDESSGKTLYQRELEALICKRVQFMRDKDKKKRSNAGHEDELCPVNVEELVLVRDFNGRLSSIKELAKNKQDLAIAQYCEDDKQTQKLQTKVDSAEAHLAKKLNPEDELDVVRAFAILSTSKDAGLLLTDYRFSTYGTMRRISQCLSSIGIFECCCPVRHKMFRESAIRVRRAPEPSNIIWENQDVRWWIRLLRRSAIGLLFFIIIVVSFVLVYSANWGAKSQMSSNSQLLGNEMCDPDPKLLVADDGSDAYKCLVWNATEWTMDFVESATKEEQACYCGAVGYGPILKDSKLFNGVCRDWLLAIGMGVGFGVAATAIVVVVNVVCKFTLLALAEAEKPLSYSALNSAKMIKIFALQTLNTGFVIFCVNFSPPEGFPLGNVIFLGEYHDTVRGWYAVVGAAILSNMMANAFTPAITNVAVMFTGRIMRCLCAKRQKHQALLLQLYTNPEFDMAARFAQLLQTIFVTMAYAGGMPMLYVFAALYMFFTYWADKIVLLRGSQRPPAYDTQIPKEASQVMLYAVALHCVGAIWMFGQPCTFPSNPLGGSLASLANQGKAQGGAALAGAGGITDRVSKESTWMIFLMLVLLVGLWVLWTVLWILGGTLGEFGKCVYMVCCPSRHRVAPAEAIAGVTWEQAKEHIAMNCPPASYQKEQHPSFRPFKDYMGDSLDFNRSRTPSPEPDAQAEEVQSPVQTLPPVAEEIAKGFIAALRAEHIDEVSQAVGEYYEQMVVVQSDQDLLEPYDRMVRSAENTSDKEEAIKEIADKWGLQATE